MSGDHWTTDASFGGTLVEGLEIGVVPRNDPRFSSRICSCGKFVEENLDKTCCRCTFIQTFQEDVPGISLEEAQRYWEFLNANGRDKLIPVIVDQLGLEVAKKLYPHRVVNQALQMHPLPLAN